MLFVSPLGDIKFRARQVWENKRALSILTMGFLRGGGCCSGFAGRCAITLCTGNCCCCPCLRRRQGAV
jgi:hypothetical protein